jgi:hypothetical protein
VIPSPDVHGHQRPRDLIYQPIIFGVGRPEAPLSEHQGFMVRVSGRRASQGGSYRQAIHGWDGYHDASISVS